MQYLWAFLVGGALCVIGQILIDKTSLTPARILTGYVVAGVILSALGLYGPLADFAGSGATVPLLGFGHLLARGSGRRWKSRGCWGASPAGSRPGPPASPPACCAGWCSLFWAKATTKTDLPDRFRPSLRLWDGILRPKGGT
mgnify:CR=1 FL=1